jgi:L-asparaginase
MEGVVIESYGIGGVSSEVLDIASKVRELTEAGVAVVLTTQCLLEGVNLQVYQVGRSMPLDKIIYGKDMNTEALVPKLMWALGKTDDPAEVKALVETSIHGDMLENSEQFYFS